MLRRCVGKYALPGFDSLDCWNRSVDQRVLSSELKKLDKGARKRLAEKPLAEARYQGSVTKRGLDGVNLLGY